MPITVQNIEAELRSESPAPPVAPPSQPPRGQAALDDSDRTLVERLRPIVLDIVRDELEKLRLQA
jgi:hypothetical protein